MSGPGTTPGLLVVSQDAGRGSDQLQLLQLVRRLRREGAPVRLFLWEGGPLLAPLRATGADVQVVDELHRWGPGRVLQRAGRHRTADRLRSLRLRRRLARGAATHPVVVVHGARPARLLAYLHGDRPVVAHLHDLPEGATADDLRALLGDVDATAVLARLAGVVVADDRQVDLVRTATGLDAGRVHVQARYGDGAAARPALGVPPGATALVAVGTEDWWRAPDPVVPVLASVRERRPDLDLHLVWLAPPGDDDDRWPLRHEAAAAGLGDRVHVVSTEVPVDHLAAADVVLVLGDDADRRRLAPDLEVAARPTVRSEGSPSATADAVLALLDGQGGDDEGRGRGWDGAGDLLAAVRTLAGGRSG